MRTGFAALLALSPLAAVGEEAPGRDVTAWLRRASTPVRGGDVGDADLSDLEPVRGRLKDVRVVMLGEATHEDGATLRAKGRWVRFLHERLGYDDLAFEAPEFDTALVEEALHRPELPVEQALAIGLFGNAWRADEVLELFRYVRSTYATAHPIRLAGIDPALQDPRAYLLWLEGAAARRVPGAIDRPLAFALATAVERFPKLGKVRPLTVAERDTDRAAWERALARLDGRQEAEGKVDAAGRRELSWMQHTLRSVLALYDWHAAVHAEVSTTIDWNGHPESNNVRDAAMATNLLWLVGERGPAARVMVWAATFHTARELRRIDARFTATKPMGEQVAASLGAALYVVGTTARAGMVGATESLPPAPAASWEALTASAVPSSCFVDLTTPGMPEALRTVSARALGFRDFAADWSRVVDGLVVLPRAEPAKVVQ